MKIQKTELATKLNQIKGVVPKKTTMPILQGILVKEGYLIANNLEMTVKAKLEGTEGECFIIPERAFDLINNLPDGEVDISVSNGNTMTIRADKIKNKYQTMDPEPFPVADIDGEGSEFTLKAGQLLESVKRVSYAIPQQGGNATMSTMCLQAKDGQLNFVGLDGHVLAWDKIDYDGEFELLIPKNTIDKIKYYQGYTSANGKLKHGTKVHELLKLSNEKSDYTEQNIVERKESIIEGFLQYLKDNELIG